MPFARGTPKPPGSGRKKGTPNRITREAAERLEDLGCDPIEGMARLAGDTKNTPELRGRMYAELAQYVYPKRKAVEHSGAEGQPWRGPLDITIRRLDPPPGLDKPAKAAYSVVPNRLE
jgi:hypothetical protein